MFLLYVSTMTSIVFLASLIYLHYIHHVLLLTNTKAGRLNPLSNEFIKLLNDGNHSWKAKQNFPETANIHEIRYLMGSSLDDKYYKVVPNIAYELDPGEQIPKCFDSRKQWKHCPSLNEISEQGLCASCWAVSAADTMSDRYCIFSNQTVHTRFSSHNLISCCVNGGCKYGGEISVAWQYWSMFGIVSGGTYTSKYGCQPFKLPPCDFTKGCNRTSEMPICEHKCQDGYNITYKTDKKFAKRIYSIKGGEKQIQMAIMKNGPVQTVMSVYEDFLSYKCGVYRHVSGGICGGHAVRLLGWGEENGNKFWFAANSWGTRWGNRGFFKIIRGEDHCDIETTVMAGDPDIADKRLLNLRESFDNKVRL